MLQKIVASEQEGSSEERRVNDCYQSMKGCVMFERIVTRAGLDKAFRKDYTISEMHRARARLAQDSEIDYEMADFEDGMDEVREIFVYGRDIARTDRLKLFY